MQTDIRQTLVIPAHNEEALLPRLLDTVDIARARYSFGAGAIEVIVKDGNVTLRGKVEEDKQKNRAEKIAKKVSGVKSVMNELQLSRP